MTLAELLRIGDKVRFKISPEYRAQLADYKDVPDGTEGVVCGFYDAVLYYGRTDVLVHGPGTYYKKGAVSIWLPNGRIVPGGNYVEMIDKEEEKRRSVAARDSNGVFNDELVRLGNLPPTAFWERDKVYVRLPHRPEVVEECFIARVNYGQIHNTCNDGSPYPFYEVQRTNGGTIATKESRIELKERGNVWKFYHKEPLNFADLREEASFFRLIGQTTDVRNPKDDLYNWTTEEVLEAIRNGLVHGFSVESGFFGGSARISAIRFRNEDLGRRVAQETLAGFTPTPT
jgi:hypothetical protein